VGSNPEAAIPAGDPDKSNFQGEKVRIKFILSGLLLALAPMFAAADTYPTGVVRLLVPFSPGGTSDLVGRVTAQQMSEQMNTSIVVENRVGGSGVIAYSALARSQPNGYMLGVAEMGLTIVPSLRKTPPFSATKDFTPISLLMRTPMVLVIDPTLKANNLAEFIAMARANPGKLNYGSAGVGSVNHLSGEFFKRTAKVDIAHVPFKGGAGEVTMAMMGGQIQMFLTPAPSVLPHIKSGKLRALAVASNKREPSIPDVPTTAEAGLSDLVVYSWFGLVGPPSMPKDIVNKLQSEASKALANPAVKARLSALGGEPVGSSSEDFSTLLESEVRRWSEIIESAGIKAE